MRELIGILRGVTPNDVVAIAESIIEAGFDKIEVPLNSPSPFESIELLAKRFGDSVLVGAGTVLTSEEVRRLSDVGGKMVVSPNCDPTVIKATKAAEMLSFPGVLTPTEAFAALHAGADGLKFFPCSVIGSSGVKALNAVLPDDTKSYAVGGAGASNFADWFSVGITGFGIGSALYKSGDNAREVGLAATQIVDAYDQARE